MQFSIMIARSSSLALLALVAALSGGVLAACSAKPIEGDCMGSRGSRSLVADTCQADPNLPASSSSSGGGSPSGGSSSGTPRTESTARSAPHAASTELPDDNRCVGTGSISVSAVAPDGGSVEDGAGSCPSGEPVSSTDLDNQGGWSCPATGKGACTTVEIATFSANLHDMSIVSWTDLGKGLSASCRGCLITDNTASAWAPVVVTAGTNGRLGHYNFGACFGYLAGASCGRAVHYLESCIDIACDRCGTIQEHDACVDAAGAGTCKGFVDAVQTHCPNLEATGTKCNDIAVAAATLCGP